MLFSKCLRAKIYCNMNGHFDPQGCQTLLLKESELFFYLWAPGLYSKYARFDENISKDDIDMTWTRIFQFILVRPSVCKPGLSLIMACIAFARSCPANI